MPTGPLTRIGIKRRTIIRTAGFKAGTRTGSYRSKPTTKMLEICFSSASRRLTWCPKAWYSLNRHRRQRALKTSFRWKRAYTISRSIRLTREMREARKTTVLKFGPSKRSSAEEVVRRIVEVAAAEQRCAVAAIHRTKKSGQTWAIYTAEDGERMGRERNPGGSHHNRVAYVRTLLFPIGCHQVDNGLGVV